MDYIKQYQKLIDIKPDYYKLEIPFFRSSKKRFIFNIEEMEIWKKSQEVKGGGNKILIIVE